MGTGELASGVALAAVPALAAVVVAVVIVRRRFAHLDRTEGFAAGALIWTAALMVIHVVPLMLGVLDQATVLVTSAAAAGAVLLVPPADTRRPDPPRESAPTSSRLSWLLAGAVGLVVLAALGADVRELLPQLVRGEDTPGFHLPQAASWLESGSLWQIDEYYARSNHGYYPGNAVLLIAWTLLPLDSEVLVRPVMVAFLPLWAGATWLAARELGAPPAARVLAAATLCSIPIVARGTVANAMGDVILYAAMTAGVAFLLRHRRSGRRSDLVLAGIGLGIGVGTKWYGIPAAAVVLAVWALPLLRDAARRGRFTGDVLAVGLPTLLGGLPWLVRNLVESGNPLFPVEVSVFGVTIFDAPHDVLREQTGFTIAEYLGTPDLYDTIASEIVQGVGLAAIVTLLAVLVAAAVAARRSGPKVVLAAAVAVVALAAAYAVTPYTGLGAPDDPVLADVNTRYLVPAIIGGVLIAAWAAGRGRPGVVAEVLLAAAAVAAIPEGYSPPARQLAYATVALLLVAGAVWVLVLARRRTTVPVQRAVAAVVAVVVCGGAFAYLDRTEDRFAAARGGTGDDVVSALWGVDPDQPMRVGVAGTWTVQGPNPVWPAFGRERQNVVRPIGEDQDGFLVLPGTASEFAQQVRRGRYDLLVVGRGQRPPAMGSTQEESWAAAAGYRQVARSPRLSLFVSSDAEAPGP